VEVVRDSGFDWLLLARQSEALAAKFKCADIF
jgi:hypothetical protein